MTGPFFEQDRLMGLDRAKKLIGRLISSNSGVHAALFYGQPGAGTTSLAMALGQAWLCPKATVDGPCGVCGVCTSFAASRCVDFQHILPWGATNIIKITAMKEPKPGDTDIFTGVPTLTFFRTRPLMAKNKVVIIEHGERMNESTSNALLKTLEEPPAHSKIIITTSELGSVRPTIRSRCLLIACELPEGDAGSVFGETPGMAAQISAAQEEYDALLATLESSSLTHTEALGLSRRVRAHGEALAKKTGWNARRANAEIARCLASWLKSRPGTSPIAIQSAVEAYRAILGNGSASIVFDGLFCAICSGSKEPFMGLVE